MEKIKRKYSAKNRETRSFWLFISPWIIGFLCFTVVPIVVSFVLSFTNARVSTITTKPPKFIGLKNYIELFTVDRLFLKSILNTFIYAIARVFLSIFWGLIIALGVNRKMPCRTITKLMIYLPCVLPAVASGLIFQMVFYQDKSLFVYIIHSLFGGKEVALNTKYLAMPSLILIGTFFGVGGNMILLLAALNNVPKEIVEAAKIDGVNSRQELFHITLPMISPTIFFLLVTGFIGCLQAYAEIELVTGRSEYTMTMAMFVVDNSFGGIGIGYGLAASWIIFVIVLLFTVIFYKSTIKKVYFGDE